MKSLQSISEIPKLEMNVLNFNIREQSQAQTDLSNLSMGLIISLFTPYSYQCNSIEVNKVTLA